MRLRINNLKKYKLSNLYVSAWKIQLFQKNYPKFLNTFVDTPVFSGNYPVLLAAGGRPSTWSPPGRLVEHDSVLQNNYFHIFPAHWATTKHPQKIINVLCTWHVTVNQVTARENCIEESTSRLPGNVAARTKHLHGRIALVPGDWTVNQGLPSKTCRAVLIDLWKHHQTRKIKKHPQGKKL